MYQTIEQEYNRGKRGPGKTRIVNCEYQGRTITCLDHFSDDYYTVYFVDGKVETLKGDSVVVTLGLMIT